jgi:hypothetical protein
MLDSSGLWEPLFNADDKHMTINAGVPVLMSGLIM